MPNNKGFYNTPPPFNSGTIAAIKEAEQGKYAGTLDVTSFAAFMASINKIS